MTQRDRVLRALQLVGERGVTQADWLRQPTPDGGPPITRLAARVEELRETHEIVVNGRRDSCAVYVLRSKVHRCMGCFEELVEPAADQRCGFCREEAGGEATQLTLEDVA